MNKPIHVLHLDLGPSLRGGQRQVWYLARRLACEEGFLTTIAAPRGAPLLDKAREIGVETLTLPGRREWDPRLWLRLSRFIASRGVRILHTHDARAAALGALLKTRFGGRLMLVHTRRVSYPLKGGFSRWKYLAADLVVGVSREIGETLAASGVRRDRLAVVHSGIEPASYPAKREKGAGEPLVIGLIGSLTPQKGVDVLLRALALLAARVGLSDWRGMIVGDGSLAGELANLAASLGLEGRVSFAGWRESREVLPDFDVMAVPSVDGEGSSGAIKEAWVAGAALVASDLPSNLELLRPEENGLAARRGDPVSLAESLARLLLQPELRARLVARGAQDVAAFTDEAMAEAYIRLYRDRFADI